MKALTLWNPWAVFMATGRKGTETRSWGTGYRGPLAIHAAKMTQEHRDICMEPEYLTLIREEGFKSVYDLPSGAVVAIGRLVACEPMTVEMCRWIRATNPIEFMLGDWAPGRYAWRFELDDCLIDGEGAIPMRGYQGLWNAEIEVTT